MSIVNKNLCLNLNAHWQPIGFRSVRDAIIDLSGASLHVKPACLALDLNFELDEDGNPMYDKPTYMNAVTWDEWLELPIRDFDYVINTQHKKIRIPTITIASNFKKMPIKNFGDIPSKYDIYIRDGGICQYTGKKIHRSNGTIDHVIPKSKGGSNRWDNLVLCSKDVNTKKGNKSLKESGLKLRSVPRKPDAVPISHLITERNHPSWSIFLK